MTKEHTLIPVDPDDAPFTTALLRTVLGAAVQVIGNWMRNTILEDAQVSATVTVYDGYEQVVLYGEVDELCSEADVEVL